MGQTQASFGMEVMLAWTSMYVVETKKTEQIASYALKAAWSERIHTGHETRQERVHWRRSGSKTLITG